MNEIVRKDAVAILKRIIEILSVKEEKDVSEIRRLSNHTIHNASVFQDGTSVSIAILVYSLSKIIERKQWRLDYESIVSLFQSAEKFLERKNFEEYNKIIKKLFALVSNIDSKLKLYIEEVINQAEIKKGSKLYEHGISLGRAAEVLGISEWELMGYIGKTRLSEDVPDIIDLSTRIKFTRSLFK